MSMRVATQLRPARTLTTVSKVGRRVSNRTVTRTRPVRPMATLGDRKQEAPDHSDVLSYSLDCQGIECLLPLSGQVLSLEDERDVLAIKNGAASGARRSSEERLEYAYTLECEATDCLVPISDQVIALEDPADVNEIMRGVVSGSEAVLHVRLKDRTEWIKQHKLRCEAMECLVPYSSYLLATEDDFDVKA